MVRLEEHGNGGNTGKTGRDTESSGTVGLLGSLLNLGRLGEGLLGDALNALIAVGDGDNDGGVGSDNGTSGGDGDGSLGDGGGLDGGGLSLDGLLLNGGLLSGLLLGGSLVLEHGSGSEGDSGLTTDVVVVDGVDVVSSLGGGAGGPGVSRNVDVVLTVDLNVSGSLALRLNEGGTVAELDGLAVGEQEHVLDLKVGGLVRAADDELLAVGVDDGVLDVGTGSDGDDAELLGRDHGGGGGKEDGGELHCECNECGGL